jgi:hypothetical protein
MLFSVPFRENQRRQPTIGCRNCFGGKGRLWVKSSRHHHIRLMDG